MKRNTWKEGERRVAEFFGTVRTPLSGSASRHTESDTLHPWFYIETKHRKIHAIRSHHDEEAPKARREEKIPILCYIDYNRPGFMISIHSSDFAEVLTKYRLHLLRNMGRTREEGHEMESSNHSNDSAG